MVEIQGSTKNSWCDNCYWTYVKFIITLIQFFKLVHGVLMYVKYYEMYSNI